VIGNKDQVLIRNIYKIKFLEEYMEHTWSFLHRS